ncbi:MAG TPA: Mpo1-like protein, partial [Bacteroidia bacterium]|nr:Mpo1-like protein [Bacteroidia bacterium]
MKSINQWLSEYGESHQNHRNKTIHFICVPLIFFSIIGLLYSIKLTHVSGTEITLAQIMLVGVAI